jgi:hypothetical protein
MKSPVSQPVKPEALKNSVPGQTAWPAGRRAVLISFLLAVLIMFIATLRIGMQVVRYQDLQMDYDEAVHATRGLDMASAVAHLSPSQLWFQTVKPHWYPPVHGYFLGSWLLLFGSGTAEVRLYATFCYFLFGLLLWASAKQAFPQAHPLSFLIPTLFLVSDQQHAVHAALSMLELPAIVLAFASLYFFNKALSRSTFFNHFLAGLFALLCFLTKYNYGLVVLFTEAICYLALWIGRRAQGEWIQRVKTILIAWLPVLALLVIWLFVLDEWQWLVAYSTAQPGQYAFWSYENLVFYPRQLLRETSGWVPLLLTLAGIILWLKRRQFSPTWLSYLVFFAVAFCMLTYKTQDSSRFGMILLPPLWIMSTGGLVVLLDLIPVLRVRHLLLGVFLVLLAFSSFRNLTTIATRLGIAYENLDSSVDLAYRFIAETVQVDRSPDLNIVMFGYTDTWNGPALHFYLQSRCQISRADCVIQVRDEREIRKGLPQQNFSPDQREARMDQALDQADYLVTFSKSPDIPDGWSPVSSQEFEFNRRNARPVRNWVTVLQRER